jgi:hypothetical protein
MFFYEVEFISQTKKDSAKRKKIQPNEKSFSQICFSQICFSQYVSAKICFSQTKKDSAKRKKIQPFEKRFSQTKKSFSQTPGWLASEAKICFSQTKKVSAND